MSKKNRPANQSHFDELLMAEVYNDKASIKPLNKEKDVPVKRFIRDGGSPEKPKADKEENKKENLRKAPVSEPEKEKPEPIREDAEQKKAAVRPAGEKAIPESGTPDRDKAPETAVHNKVQNKVQRNDDRSIPESELEERLRPEDFDDDEETTIMSNEVKTKFPYLLNASTGEKTHIINTPFLIGKRQSCDLSINSRIVSREHAKIVTDGQKYFIIDLNSKNGTYLSGYKLIPQAEIEIKYGQSVVFANEKYVFKEG